MQLHKIPRIDNFIETEDERFPGLVWGKGKNEELFLNWHRISFWGDENFGNSGDDCTTL